MEKVKIYQIGLGSFGRHGFEKFVDMTSNFEDLEVEFAGICDRDPEKLESAERFARHHGIDIETFNKINDLYEEASGENVLIYDAGPSDIHPDNIYESLNRGFYHLTEKPSSMDREQHLSEKDMARNRDVTFAVDFIERENPVVKKTLEIIEDESIDSINVFRESTMGVEKILNPVERIGVVGGDIMDKMVHEAYVLDFLEASDGDYEIELESVDCEFFAPKDFQSEKLMGYRGGHTQHIEDAATGTTQASFSHKDKEIKLHSSWLGLSNEALKTAKKIKEKTGESVLDKNYIESEGEAFRDDEARFFVIKGSRNLAGDMLHNKLYDLDTEEEISTRDHIHDQLYRVLEKSIYEAVGVKKRNITDKETDIFMNGLFDVREASIKDKDFTEFLNKSNDRLEALRIRDGKILEVEERESLAG